MIQLRQGVMLKMEELLQILDDKLQYIGHEIKEDVIEIRAASKLAEAKCPYCETMSAKVHSRVKRVLKDLPIQSKKVKIVMELNKYFCKNPDCRRKTFAERFSFFEPNAVWTNRLKEEIVRVSLTQSSISASRYLRASVADVGKSAICNMLKKGRHK